MYIHLLNIMFVFGYTFILQNVKELKHFGTIAAPAEMQLECKEKTNLASIIIPDLDLTVFSITFLIVLICNVVSSMKVISVKFQKSSIFCRT